MSRVSVIVDCAETDLPRETPLACPHCNGTVFEEGFGLAGGSFGPYQWCANVNCNRLVSKQPLAEDEE